MNASEQKAIVGAMRGSHGIDISMYDASFVAKSVSERVRSASLKSVAAYTEVLSEDGAEAAALSDSLNIIYSDFFRDPLAFAALERAILPSLIAVCQRSRRAEIRVWSAGCATGQEAYSVAMLLDGLLAERECNVGFRLFGTDRSDAGLASARKGTYHVTALGNVRFKHVRYYFTQRGETYTVVSRLRDRIHFSADDLLDAESTCPSVSIFGDFDLVVCCNLLFYYGPDSRRSILEKLHGSLAPHGYLMTGEAERTIVQHVGGYRAVTPSVNLFRKTG